DLVARADLSGVSIRKPNLFDKKPGEVFQISFAAKQQKEDIGIEKSEIKLPFATVNVGGKVHNPKDPSFDLKVNGDISNLDMVRPFVSSLKDIPMSGSMKAQLSLNGKMDSKKAWNDWPIKISGLVNWNAPKLKIGLNPKPDAPADKGAPK